MANVLACIRAKAEERTPLNRNRMGRIHILKVNYEDY